MFVLFTSFSHTCGSQDVAPFSCGRRGGSDRRALKHCCCSESHGEKKRSILPTVLTRVCVITFSLRPNTWDLQCSRHVEVFVGLE